MTKIAEVQEVLSKSELLNEIRKKLTSEVDQLDIHKNLEGLLPTKKKVLKTPEKAIQKSLYLNPQTYGGSDHNLKNKTQSFKKSDKNLGSGLVA